MGGGAAMRVVGKIAGVVNGSRFPPAFPENITTSAFQASTTRPITTILSSSDTQIQIDYPLPRLVFAGPPTLDEAKDATFELRSALDHCKISPSSDTYLSNESSGGSFVSDAEHDKLEVSDSAPKHAIQAFRLLKENAAVQTVVASIASDQKIFTAVCQNEAVLEFFKSQNIGYQSPKYSDNEMFDEKEPKKGFNSFFEDIKVKTEEMMNGVSGFFQNILAGPETADGSIKADKTMGASIMGLAVMVIMIVVFKRV